MKFLLQVNFYNNLTKYISVINLNYQIALTIFKICVALKIFKVIIQSNLLMKMIFIKVVSVNRAYTTKKVIVIIVQKIAKYVKMAINVFNVTINLYLIKKILNVCALLGPFNN